MCRRIVLHLEIVHLLQKLQYFFACLVSERGWHCNNNVYLLLYLCVCQPLRVRGCILTLVERMDEEFNKVMQNTDPHSQGELYQKKTRII